MDRPPIRDGAVVFEHGHVVAVGPAAEVAREHPQAEQIDLGRAVVVPGLVNAHTHLELTTCPAGEAPASFADWILSIPKRLGRDRLTPQEVFPAAAAAGIAQCLRFGVTCVGDISQHMDLTRPVLRASPLRAVSYGEVLGLATMRWRYEELLARAVDLSNAGGRLVVGLTPHAPYTVDRAGYEQCLSIARQRGMPLATHLAETWDERQFLEEHSGPFRSVWESLGLWEDGLLPRHSGGPIRFARDAGLLAYPALLAHVNYCDDAELAILAGGRASVVYCPRTHRYFGHPPHPWRRMVERGINVAVGTDSCASSPDLNLLEDLRVVRRLAPDMPADRLWQLITTNAARALGMEAQVGSLSPGRCADAAVFHGVGNDPLAELLDAQVLPSQVWIGGERVAGDSAS